MAETKLTPMNRALEDYPDLLRAIADDLAMDCPAVVRHLAAQTLYEYAVDLQALAIAYAAEHQPPQEPH